MHATEAPRNLRHAWRAVTGGLAVPGRRHRYLVVLLPLLLGLWLLTAAYLVFAPPRFTSSMTFILPGSGAGGSMNVESIGQASATTASAFANSTLSPTENYKRLLAADVTIVRAARRLRLPEESFPAPVVTLTDQTNLIEVKISGPSAAEAQRRSEALRLAFLTGLDRLRADEAATREAADRGRIADLQTKAQAAQRRLLAFQGSSGLVSLEQFNQRISMLDILRERERVARVQQRQQAAIAASLGQSLDISLDGARAAFVLKADPLFQSLLSRYAAVATTDVEKGATLGARHATMAELGATKAALRGALVNRGTALTGLPAARLLAFADLSAAEGRARMFEALVNTSSQIAGADAAVGEVRRQINEQVVRSVDLVSNVSMLADLVRDVRIADAVLSSALARLDTNKADPFASYPLVQTLDAPSLPRHRSSPSMLLAIIGALAASLFLLIGFALAWLRQPLIDRLLPSG